MFQKVLVPLDGSAEAEVILPFVSQLAKGLNTPLVLVSVIDQTAAEAYASYLLTVVRRG